MAGSFHKIDYRLRPAKHAERSMLIDLFKRMRFGPIEDYKYVGFGSVAFIDFRMVHRTLGISQMISIEDADDDLEKERFRHNSPYSHLTLIFGNSAAVIPTLNINCRALVWLDYDNALKRSMANDLASVASRVLSGSFLGFTVNCSFPPENPNRERELTRLKNEFPDFIDEGDSGTRFNGDGLANFARETFEALLQRAVSDADAGIADDRYKRRVRQVAYFRYKDGAQMATIGWLIVSDVDQAQFDNSHFELLQFYKTSNDPFRIKVPKVTPLEIHAMEKRISDLTTSPELAWLPIKERKAFVESYRYLPNFVTTEKI